MKKPSDLRDLKRERDQRQYRDKQTAIRQEARAQRVETRKLADKLPEKRQGKTPSGPMGAEGKFIKNVIGRVPTGTRGKTDEKQD